MSPASLGTEEKLLELLLKKKAWAETKAYIGLSAFKPSELFKKTTAKEFGEKEFKESENWARIEVDAIEWETTKSEGETGFTIFKNKNSIKFLEAGKQITGAEEKTLETFAILEKAKQSEDAAESKGIFVFGKLTTKVTVNKATTELVIGAKELQIECE